jgi:hypothetical protein
VSASDELITGAARYDEALGAGVRAAVAAAINTGVKNAREVHRWQNRSGDSVQKIWGQVTGSTADGSGAFGFFVADSNVLVMLAHGTPAHEIRPKEGHGFVGPLPVGQSRRKRNDIGTHRAALRWNDAGGVHFARVVNHPGTQPDDYMDKAAEAARRDLEERIEAAVEVAIRAWDMG